MIRARLKLACTLVLCLPVVSQAPTPKDVTILLGQGELLQFETDILRVAVAEPKVADAVVVSPREVMVNAKGLGSTSIVVWETGQLPIRYTVRVKPDEESFDLVKKSVADSLPGSNITLTGSGDTVVLTGDAKSEEESKRAAALASTHAKNVVNLIKTPAPASGKQILLQVKFAAIDRVALQEIGVNLFSRNPTMLGAVSTQQFPGPRFSQLQDASNTVLNFSDLLNIFLYRPDLNIGATVKALQTRNLLQILAEPNLITMEGKEASFLAGGQFPFPVLTATSTGGAVAPVVSVQFKNFGVELSFTPTITNDGSIHLKVNPSVSALDFANAVTIQGQLIPAISTRTASTEVELKDGESFAIAGLLDNRVIQTLSKIPWLGDIPILGYLFQSRSTKKSQDELLVVVTPKFVRPLTPEEKAKMPTDIEPYLESAEQELAKKNKGKKGDKKPELAGPTGFQEAGKDPKK